MKTLILAVVLVCVLSACSAQFMFPGFGGGYTRPLMRRGMGMGINPFMSLGGMGNMRGMGGMGNMRGMGGMGNMGGIGNMGGMGDMGDMGGFGDMGMAMAFGRDIPDMMNPTDIMDFAE